MKLGASEFVDLGASTLEIGRFGKLSRLCYDCRFLGGSLAKNRWFTIVGRLLL